MSVQAILIAHVFAFPSMRGQRDAFFVGTVLLGLYHLVHSPHIVPVFGVVILKGCSVFRGNLDDQQHISVLWRLLSVSPTLQ